MTQSRFKYQESLTRARIGGFRLELQIVMDRMTKAEKAVSNMAQKSSETADAIAGKMK